MTHIPAPTTEADRDLPGVLVVVVADGDLDMIGAPDLAIDLGLAMSTRPRAVIADLTAVRFLSAAGLSALERAHDYADSVSSRLAVVTRQRCVLLPLALTRLDEVLAVFPDLLAARAALNDLVDLCASP